MTFLILLKLGFFYSDNFGKTMTMTAISKGFRRIMKLLSECSKIHENNVNSKTMWTNKFENVSNEQQFDKNLGMFYELKILIIHLIYISIRYLLIYV